MGESIADILMIGGGPVGLNGLYLTGLHHMRTVVIERLSSMGGQLEHLYPEKPIYDVGGFARITGRELAGALQEQAGQYAAEIHTDTTALSLKEGPAGWRVQTDHGEYQGRAVIITAGIGEFIPRRFDNLEIDRWEGRGLSYVVDSLEPYRGRKVLVVGGGDSAADWAMAVAPIAEQVWMIHRRPQFQCHEDSLARLKALDNVTLIPEHELVALHGDGETVGSVQIRHKDTGAVTAMDASAVIVAIGLVPGTGIFHTWGVAMNGHEIGVTSAMHTNLEGVFAAGDIVSYPGKVKLISAGFGEVATAVESARQYLFTAPTPKVRQL
jgi:thioredoxin reductase (NADPH)